MVAFPGEKRCGVAGVAEGVGADCLQFDGLFRYAQVEQEGPHGCRLAAVAAAGHAAGKDDLLRLAGMEQARRVPDPVGRGAEVGIGALRRSRPAHAAAEDHHNRHLRQVVHPARTGLVLEPAAQGLARHRHRPEPQPGQRQHHRHPGPAPPPGAFAPRQEQGEQTEKKRGSQGGDQAGSDLGEHSEHPNQRIEAVGYPAMDIDGKVQPDELNRRVVNQNNGRKEIIAAPLAAKNFGNIGEYSYLQG